MPYVKKIKLRPVIHCENCGTTVKKRRNRFCSLKCSGSFHGRNTEHKERARAGLRKRHGTDSWQACATCHANIGINGKMSGDLAGKNRGAICAFRKKNGMKTLSLQEARASAELIHGRFLYRNHQRYCPQLQAFRKEQQSIVDNYWTQSRLNALTLARMEDSAMAGRSNDLVKYYLNHEESKRRCAARARERHRTSAGDSSYSIKKMLRNQIHRVCRKSKTGKTRKTIEYLGCDMNVARLHIQRRFKRGMNWNNHGTVWEIDHIIPMSCFDLSRDDHRLRVNHFTNLSPEFIKYNREKAGKMIGEHQMALI